jgi:hypothetical protein
MSLLLALALAACGGGDDDGGGGDSAAEENGDDGSSSESVSAAAWASEICTAVTDWGSTIQEQAGALSTDFQSGSPEEGKEVLTSFIGDAVAETETLLDSVEGAGVPDVDGGEEFAQQLNAAFTEARDILVDVQGQIESLPTDPQGFQQAAGEIGPSVQEALGAVGESISEPESQELKDAFEQEEACSGAPGA